MSIRIMVAIHDGSRNAATMELAGDWAARLGASVVGVGILDQSVWSPAPVSLDVPSDESEPPPMHPETRLARAEKRVAQSLAELEAHCHGRGVHYRQVRQTGTPQETIVMEAQRHDAILLAKESVPDPGVGVPARTILADVLRNTPRPVVAVPDAPREGQGVMIAYDGSLPAARAVQALVASGLNALGGVKVLSIDDVSAETAGERAARAADYLAVHGVDAERLTLKSEKATEQVILDEAQRHGAEMIVMGAHGRSRLAEFFLGSVTSRMIEESPLPVFLFH